MSEETGMGLILLAVGLSGWLLPFKWNLLRLKGNWAKRFSEETNKKIPKIVGTIVIIAGILVLLGIIQKPPGS